MRHEAPHLTSAFNAIGTAQRAPQAVDRLRAVLVAEKEIGLAKAVLVASVQGDRGGFPPEVDINGQTYRVVRFDPQTSEHRIAKGHLGALVIERANTLYVIPVGTENSLDPSKLRKVA